MIPLIPALALVFFSFSCSAFVILRIVIPVLPPSPLSKRVSPAEFGLPKFGSLSATDKGHIWLASLDIVALAIFVWQIINEAISGPSDFANASDPASSVRIWFLSTVRQTFFLIITSITLLHVRMARSISFGAKQWMLWTPVVLLAATSTVIAGVMSGAGLDTLFIGLISYSSAIAILSSVAFTCLTITLAIIKRNPTLNEQCGTWPPVKMMEERRPYLRTEDIDDIRDGASWITSNPHSRRSSISAWSFSSRHSVATPRHNHSSLQKTSCASFPAKSPFWFGSAATHVNDAPLAPPLTSPYCQFFSTSSPPPYGSVHESANADSFRREPPFPDKQRARLDSQTSWLTSTNGSHTTLSAWSYPVSIHEGSVHNASSPDLRTTWAASSRRAPLKLANAQVLGGYGYVSWTHEAGKGLAALATSPGTNIHIFILRLLAWLLYIWIPLILSLPYLVVGSQQNTAPAAISILFVLSVTLSSPLLALTILLRSSIPIPSELFDIRMELPSTVNHSAPFKLSHDCKRSVSTSPTVVEGRRSGDVWLTNGNAVDGKSKIGRAVDMLWPMPKLSVIPAEEIEDGKISPTLPIPDEGSSIPNYSHNRSHSETCAQFELFCGDLRASSQLSTRNSLTNSGSCVHGPYQSTSLPTATVASIIASGPVATTGAAYTPSPPPSWPLPPTPPSIKLARRANTTHRKSFSSESGLSFGKVDDFDDIDAFTASFLHAHVPGVEINDDGWSSPRIFADEETMKRPDVFGGNFSSPQLYSTPTQYYGRNARYPNSSFRKRNPSLDLGKVGLRALSNFRSSDVQGVEEDGAGEQCMPVFTSNTNYERRDAILDDDFGLGTIPYLYVEQENVDPSTTQSMVGITRSTSMPTRTPELRVKIPCDAPRGSLPEPMASPLSATSSLTLFEEFVAGLDSEPQSQSTPHRPISGKPARSNHLPLTKKQQRSSIFYVKCDDHTAPTSLDVTSDSATTPSSSVTSTFAQWSTHAVQPLVPKVRKLHRKISNISLLLPSSKPGFPSENLRPLTLLQDRRNRNSSHMIMDTTRPLNIEKSRKVKGVMPSQDQNLHTLESPCPKTSLRPLKLAQAGTSTTRGY